MQSNINLTKNNSFPNKREKIVKSYNFEDQDATLCVYCTFTFKLVKISICGKIFLIDLQDFCFVLSSITDKHRKIIDIKLYYQKCNSGRNIYNSDNNLIIYLSNNFIDCFLSDIMLFFHNSLMDLGKIKHLTDKRNIINNLIKYYKNELGNKKVEHVLCCENLDFFNKKIELHKLILAVHYLL